MGILAALYLIPEGLQLLGTVGLDLLQRRPFIHQLSALEHRYLQYLGGKIGKGLTLPGGLGIEDLQRLRLVHRLVVHGDIVRLRLAGGLVKEQN